MNPRQAAAARLAHGAAQLAQQLGERSTAWVRAGRRADLEGWRAALGCVARAALLVGGLWLLWRAVRAVPALMLLLVPVGLLAAWRTGRSPGPAEATEATNEQPLPDTPPAVDIPAAVRATCGTHSGSHLAVLAQHLTRTTGREWDVAAVRAACTAAGITTAQVRMGTGPKAVTTGVRLRDLPGPSPDPTPVPAVGVVVAGQDAPTHPPTPTPTAPTTADRERGFMVVQDEKNPARHHILNLR